MLRFYDQSRKMMNLIYNLNTVAINTILLGDINEVADLQDILIMLEGEGMRRASTVLVMLPHGGIEALMKKN